MPHLFSAVYIAEVIKVFAAILTLFHFKCADCLSHKAKYWTAVLKPRLIQDQVKWHQLISSIEFTFETTALQIAFIRDQYQDQDQNVFLFSRPQEDFLVLSAHFVEDSYKQCTQLKVMK